MTNTDFNLKSDFAPTGDQPQAIGQLTQGINAGLEHQVLLGVTGSGKTFSVANVVEKVQKPTLVISHNKTLTAQLYQEFRDFFPENEIHYFVSYYDYYQPEAYVPQRDLYIEKEVDINKEIEKLRHSATAALITRKDVIVVASVSCIYGLGRPSDYAQEIMVLEEDEKLSRGDILRDLIDLLYERNDWDLKRGCFRVRGENVEVFPPYGGEALRISILGRRINKLEWIEPETGRVVEPVKEVKLLSAKHFITPRKRLKQSISRIEQELQERLEELKNQGKDIEAHRLKVRTEHDLELLEELGYCPGVENYSRYLSGRSPGEPPYTLIDYFRHSYGDDFLCVIDESHMTVPQIRGMYNGDRARKENLVNFGFRLPSALDNRPLTFDEFQDKVSQTIYTSATPSDWEIKRARSSAELQISNDKIQMSGKEKSPEELAGKKLHNGVVEQLIRPTGLLDPKIEVRPAEGQIEDLIKEIVARKLKKERALVTTLTKRMAEDLASYLNDEDKLTAVMEEKGDSFSELQEETVTDIKAEYLHSEIETLERSDILADLRRGEFDVVVGINLLREGLDLPEVSLVAILDADKEGFLRSETALIQTMGRAARHENGAAILYAEEVTESMQAAIDEVARRRQVQKKYNQTHNITPQSIKKPIRQRLVRKIEQPDEKEKEENWSVLPPEELENKIWEWEREMRQAADQLNFEKAAELRDRIREVQKTM
ncbi:MAG: excinuclease ABC subunit UvrB [Patescibacteria group bacterium]